MNDPLTVLSSVIFLVGFAALFTLRLSLSDVRLCLEEPLTADDPDPKLLTKSLELLDIGQASTEDAISTLMSDLEPAAVDSSMLQSMRLQAAAAGNQWQAHSFMCFPLHADFECIGASTQKKGAPGGTESCSEVRGHLEKHLVKDEVVACSDAGAGLNAAWKRLNIPEATLSKAAARKRPAAVWTPAKQCVKVLAGDNVCESAIGHGKRQMRRVNLLWQQRTTAGCLSGTCDDDVVDDDDDDMMTTMMLMCCC
ncbi:hypothetical protein AK812_SmicGene15855 [Symbiodinium microadriaticum]|uniref:Uncharacterized protein n=1 Tax=Symbiodinium microadriaticum TaxID=2951 RepID=A0A1Q9E1U8_SYMMI|nr:hypothetical protein AK812_SmicGene15855 [Symbiodinium microadriaticum]